MSAPKRILCPVDFGHGSANAVGSAAAIARRGGGIVHLFHVTPLILAAMDSPVYSEICRGQEEAARSKLNEIARKHLAGIDYEILLQAGEPASAVLKAAKELRSDLIVLCTHGRRGLSRFVIGSVAERIIREASCPVLTVRGSDGRRDVVGTWMTPNPVTASPAERLSVIREKMDAGGFRCVPVVDHGKLVGIVTDRDVRTCMTTLDELEAGRFATPKVISVTTGTSIGEAARILRDHKIGGLPVLEDGEVVGIMTATDVLAALSEQG